MSTNRGWIPKRIADGKKDYTLYQRFRLGITLRNGEKLSGLEETTVSQKKKKKKKSLFTVGIKRGCL